MQKRNGKAILLKTFTKLSVRETETIIKILTPAYCPITKASNKFSFSFLSFFAVYFPSQYQWFFLSLLPFLILEIKNNCVQSHYTTRTEPRVVRSTKLSPVLRDSYLDGWPKTNTRVVITFNFFSFPFEGDIKDCRTHQPCVMSLLLFLNNLFLISPCPHSRVYLQYRTIVQINSQTRRSNSSQFSWLWSSKTITSILLLSVVLLKAIHAITFRTKFLLFVSICVPPNNPKTACGATSFPGYHSFPKWAIHSDSPNIIWCRLDKQLFLFQSGLLGKQNFDDGLELIPIPLLGLVCLRCF